MQEMFLISLGENFSSVENFFDAGGEVLYPIAIVAFLMWTLLLERAFYILISFKKERKTMTVSYKNHLKTDENKNESFKKMIISMIDIKLKKYIHTLKALIAICPMLGLLGTVLGMIEVFDVVAMLGTGNAKAMADGVSKATIPTMSGMFVALSGVFFLFWYQAKIKKEEFLIQKTLEDLT